MQPIDLRKERQQKCSLGCPILDGALNGGIPCGSVTELVGESSAGKTQLCLQLLLTVQLSFTDGGLEGSALYVYTENYFASSRLRQLSAPPSIAARANHRRGHLHFLPGQSIEDRFGRARRRDRHAHPYDVYGPPEKLRTIDPDPDDTIEDDGVAFDPCKNVYVQGVQTAEELLKYLDHAETLLSHSLRLPVRLLVIDSIAALFRSDFHHGSTSALTGRGNLFFQISSKLKRLAEKYNLAIVVSNQVADCFEPIEVPRRDVAPGAALASVGCAEILLTSGRRVVPALGISWAHCVNIRLFLSRYDRGPNSIRRSIQVVFAPHLANVWCDFLVDANGVKGVSL